MSIYGYVRVSSKDQNEARQLIAMEKRAIPPRPVSYTHLPELPGSGRQEYLESVVNQILFG